jgi:hypothetical protein
MPAYASLAMALRGHYHKPFDSVPPDIQQRILEDFAPWPWDSNTPRLRCRLAKQWDSKHDPALRELREGIEALTNPDNPAYSAEETRRLRGDFLPEPRIVKPNTVDLPPLEWDQPQQASGGQIPATGTQHSIRSASAPVTDSTKPSRRDTLKPVIEEAQSKCINPNDTAQVWAQMQMMADEQHVPLLASMKEGLKYHKAGQDAYFTRDALNKRLHPDKRGKPGKRR